MKDRWKSIEQAFNSKGLNPSNLFLPPATDSDFEQLHTATSLTLPPDAEEFYRIHNGQHTGIHGVIFGIELLSIDRMIENWQNWDMVSDDGLNEDLADSMSSDPPGVIKPMYVNLKWLPLTHDQGGNHIGLDFDPDSQGRRGQMIAFGRDDDIKKLIAHDFTNFIDMWIDELNSIDWSIESDTGWQINDPERGEQHYHDWPRKRPA